MGQVSVSISWHISVKRAPNQAFVRFRECMWLWKSPRYLIHDIQPKWNELILREVLSEGVHVEIGLPMELMSSSQ